MWKASFHVFCLFAVTATLGARVSDISAIHANWGRAVDEIVSSSVFGYAEPPKWSESYSVGYVFTIPYTAEVQPKEISYPVAFHRDAHGKKVRARMETLNGTNVMIATKKIEYELVPRLDRQVCRVFKDMEEGESIAEATALPDISGWEYAGMRQWNKAEARVWQYIRQHEAKRVEYTFYVSLEGQPLRLHMFGNDIFSGAHFDEWVVDYTYYSPGRPDPALFASPNDCQEVKPSVRGSGGGGAARGASMRMKASLPRVRYGGHARYDDFLLTHGVKRKHASLSEYRLRSSIFEKNSAMIAQHNAANQSYTMAMNRFGDWTREEFQQIMLKRPKLSFAGPMLSKGSESSVQHKLGKHELPYEPLHNPARIPRDVDWTHTGANGGGVKDQANCGSCWAFGAVGAMESAWFMATGQSLSLSEQQVMDCAWGFIPGKDESTSACDGGDAWAGVGHVVDAGGISLSKDYQYLGQDNYCFENSTRNWAAKFKGYVRLPRYDDQALMEAIYSRGPVAVSLDASQDSFTFYSSGVYYDSNCMWKPADLDHSMMAVGYGTDDAGEYWLIKNSWSRHWGDNGYVKIARDGHGCGASSDAMYAVADVSMIKAS